MGGHTVWTPAIQKALNTRVINKFQEGWASATARISGMLGVCGPRTSDAEHLVSIVIGKDFRLHRRKRGVDTVIEDGVNAYEQRSTLDNYYRFVSVDRHDAIYDKWGKVMATAEAAGAAAAEAPTRLTEAMVVLALGLECHTGESFYSAAHPQKPGSSETFPNLLELGPLDFDTFDQASNHLMKIPDEDGHSCGSRTRVLAVGPDYKEIGREIVKNRRPKEYAGGDNLRSEDGVELVVVPDWDNDVWALFDNGVDADMPFYFVEGRKLTFGPLYTDVNGAWERINQKLLWGVDGDIGGALGNPRRSVMVVEDTDPAAIAAIIEKYAAKFDLNEFGFDLT